MLSSLRVAKMTKNNPQQPQKNTPSVNTKQKVAKPALSEKPASSPPLKPLKLDSLYAFKLGMSSLYDDKGVFTPVTFLQFRPWVVSQVKTSKKDGYESLQLACEGQKNNRCSRAIIKHLVPAGFKGGAKYIREIRQNVSSLSEKATIGQVLSIESLQKGDIVTLSAVSKGHGFAGVVKRWGFKGGPASHGAKMHRRSGSVGNRTEPGRVMPGKKMAGHYGHKKVSIRNVRVWDVVPEKNLVIVKGVVPGSRNSLVYLRKTGEKPALKS